MSKIIELDKRVRKEFGVGVKEYFNFLRLQYLKEELEKDPHLRAYLRRIFRQEPEQRIIAPDLEDISIEEDWSSQAFHIGNRITTANDLAAIVENIDRESVDNLIEAGYLLSVLPLNIAINNPDLLNKFIPKPDFFSDINSDVKNVNPYGIFDKGALVEVDGVIIGSQKFKRSLLMNTTKLCHFGCVGCYKGEKTRVAGSQFYADLGSVLLQTEKLVKYLNQNPDVELVIMSGGEPLMLPNKGMKDVLGILKEAKHLSEFRICTGTIFQGLPYRIDDELLESLKQFQNASGINVYFNAHLSHPSQFTTDALIATYKIIRRYGFQIYSQIPLQRDVNIFLEEPEKTMQTLNELTHLQGRSGINPYKYILHMNCGSLEYSVPLEYMLNVLGELKYRTDHPWPETWMAVSHSILCKEGNILLSPQMVFGMEKEINHEKKYVEYKIPVPSNGGFRMATYREPLMKGYNDNPNSLEQIRKNVK
jgi:L-lysine 2,3-aminomutase